VKQRSSILVGRDAQLRTLRQALQATRDGSGSAVFLIGEGGIGKSRLAAAAADIGFADGVRLMRGRCSGNGPLVPFRCLTEALLSLLRNFPSLDLDALGPYRPILGRLVPDLRPASTEQGDGSLVILGEAVLRLTALAGKDTGSLLLLEDLHNADAETLGVVEYLVDNLAGTPLLLLGTLRAEACPALDLARSAAQRGQVTILELDRLNRDHLVAMVSDQLEIPPEAVPPIVTELLWAGSTGNPFLVEDLLSGMIESELLQHTGDGWQVSDEAATKRPETFVRSVRRRIDQLADDTRELIMVGALLGYRFPLAVAQTVTGMTDRELLNHLQGPLTAQLVVADEQTPDWYRFQHPLVQEALLILLPATERARLAGRTADAIAMVYPTLPGEWCQISAGLRIHANQRTAAARLFAEAGRRSLAHGAARSSVALLSQAWELMSDGTPEDRAETLESLIHARAEAGLVEEALALVEVVDQVGSVLDRRRRARLHTRLAWSAILAGKPDQGLLRVEAARELLGPDPAPADLAPVDVVAAHLELDQPGPDRLLKAETMARRAAAVAEDFPLPVVACQAWQLLGAIARHRDPAEATDHLERSRAIAVEHNLPIWEVHALVRLGNDDALLAGRLDRLELAQSRASRIGAVTARYQAEASIALHCVLRTEFDRAEALLDEVYVATSRMRLLETAEYVLLLRVVLAAHRGRRRDFDRALAELRLHHGDQPRHRPRTLGLAATFCALLEEDQGRARRELARAIAAEQEDPTMAHLAGRQGLHLLLAALDGERVASADEAEPPRKLFRWDNQFVLLARAVWAGRDGDSKAAAEAVAEAVEVAACYPMAHHLGLRLIAEAALADGWGTPVEWLRTAEEYFHAAGVSAVAGACRTLLRTAGVRVGQRRSGSDQIPPALRTVGVTVREFEVLQLLVKRLGNREIANRLFLSPRTVERHISNLILKTGLPNRRALSELAADEFAD
jgi:DNA-binding CsgD family transcriptional regulator